MNYAEESLKLHEQKKGKIEVIASHALKFRRISIKATHSHAAGTCALS